MHRFKLNLLFGYTHQVAYSGLSVFSPIGLDVEHLVGKHFTIESVEERHEEVFFTLEPNVVVGEIERPSPCASLGEHEEIISVCDESKSD